MSPIHVSASFYLRVLCKIHVSGFISARSMSPDPDQHPYVSQDPLQDPCLQAHVSASLHLRSLYKIHVFGFMSQHLRISGSSARSMCPIHVLAFIDGSASMCISGSSARSMSPDPYLSSHMYLRILYKIHVFGFMSQHLCISWILCKIHVSGFMSQHLYISGSSARSRSPDPCVRFMS